MANRRYAAFFRGINVGGKHIVKMVDLRQLFMELGYENVQTYIQSGNVVFDANEDKKTVIHQISEAFSTVFGFQSEMTLRTKDELKGMIDKLPFTELEISEAEAANTSVEHLYVYLLDEAPDPAGIEKLSLAYAGADRLRAGKKEIYLLCHQSIRDSRLAASLSKLGVPMTARNWKTMNRLHELLER